MSDSAMPEKFDRMLGLLTGLTDTLHTKPSTIRAVPILGVGGSSVYIVQTYRQQVRDEDGRVTESRDTVFLETIDEGGSLRIVLPPAVADVIARQRDSLSARSRSQGARAAVETRKKLGIEPGFTKGKKR
jgi:hypothetical protein